MHYDLLLLNPSLQPRRAPGAVRALRWVGGGHGWMPLGILFLASYLKKHGYSVMVLDMELYSSDDEQKLLQQYVPEASYVGISAMTAHVPHALSLTRQVKAIRPDVPVIWGGVHASLMPQQTVAHPQVDYVVVGEGEEALLQLLRGESHPRIETKSRRIEPSAYDQFIDIDEIADPDYSALEMEEYFARQGKFRNVDVLTSRGCPRRCSFCINTILKNRWRSFNAKRSISILQRVVELYKPKHTFLMDENFFANTQRAQEITDYIGSKGITWEANITIKCAVELGRAGTLSRLKKNGCTRLRMGAESGSDRLLKILRKGITHKDTEEAVRACVAAKLSPVLSFMINLPDELAPEQQSTLWFAKHCGKLGAEVIGPQRFRPYPGSEEYDKLVKRGLKVPLTLEAWAASDLFNTVH